VRENLRNRSRCGRAGNHGAGRHPRRRSDERLDAHHAHLGEAPAPALRPADAGRRGFDALVEDYADEWTVRAMLASRWMHAPDAEQNRIVIAADMTCGVPGTELAVAKEIFPQGITATLPPMGATTDSLGFLLDDLRGLVADLDALFANHRFLGGAEPTVADLALWGQLNQVRRDPTGRGIVGDPARPHGRWLGDVERRADGEAVTHAGEAVPGGEALAPVARRIAATYLRFTVANALARQARRAVRRRAVTAACSRPRARPTGSACTRC
jgi:glutathione S-transferase